MDEIKKLARIRLIQTRHIGPMTFNLLIQRYGGALAALAAIPDLAAREGRKLPIASLADAKAELAANDDAGPKLIWRDSASYPLRLAQFDDAPVTLSTRGNLHLLHKPMIALVGARNAIRHVETPARELGEAVYVIVSGMARGIDAAAPIAVPWQRARLGLLLAALILSIHRKIEPCFSKSLMKDCFWSKCVQEPRRPHVIFQPATELLPALRLGLW
jgi:DNA processing protein